MLHDILDAFYEEGRLEEAEAYMKTCLREAEDDARVLEILSEMIGFYRVLGRWDECMLCVRSSVKVAKEALDPESEDYGTVLLNAATGARAAGELREAEQYYDEVEKVYRAILPEKHLLKASLENNRSLLYAAIGDSSRSKEALKQALSDLEGLEGVEIERATSLVNLANTCLSRMELTEAEEALKEAEAIFREEKDPHEVSLHAAKGELSYKKGELEEALSSYNRAVELQFQFFGECESTESLRENRDFISSLVRRKKGHKPGLSLARGYYEAFGKPMLDKEFPQLKGRFAAGLMGEGSDCLGLDDEESSDHDFGPGFCIWLGDEDYERYGKKLQEAYDALPSELEGFPRRGQSVGSSKRVGVFSIREFFRKLTGYAEAPKNPEEWRGIPEESLLAATSGEIFEDEEGSFTRTVEGFRAFPADLRTARLRQALFRAGQSGQYNLPRMLRRRDEGAAFLLRSDFADAVLKVAYALNHTYVPIVKWRFALLRRLRILHDLPERLLDFLRSGEASKVEEIAFLLRDALREEGYEVGEGSYLVDMAENLKDMREEKKKLTDAVVRLEWKCFQGVRNEGGRADCQDEWDTFRIMREAQYAPWNTELLMSYAGDLIRAEEEGRNLLTEKYARMMEHTSPEAFLPWKDLLPVLSDEREKEQEEVIAIVIRMAEDVEKRYPKLSMNGRYLHSSEDEEWDTSMETYLRGEISTYSDQTFSLYASYVRKAREEGRNLTEETLKAMASSYGYRSLEEAEASYI